MTPPDEQHPPRVIVRKRGGSSWGWVVLVLVLVVFFLGLLAGVVALAYSPLAEGLFGPAEEAPPAPQDQIDDVPAPDNTIDQTSNQFERRAERLVGESGEIDPPGDATPQDDEGTPPIPGLDAPSKEQP